MNALFPREIDKVRFASDEACGICLTDFEINEAAIEALGTLPRTCSSRKIKLLLDATTQFKVAIFGILDSCNHIFHTECIQRWSKSENTCPLCKARFGLIACYLGDGRKIDTHRIHSVNQVCNDWEMQEAALDSAGITETPVAATSNDSGHVRRRTRRRHTRPATIANPVDAIVDSGTAESVAPSECNSFVRVVDAEGVNDNTVQTTTDRRRRGRRPSATTSVTRRSLTTTTTPRRGRLRKSTRKRVKRERYFDEESDDTMQWCLSPPPARGLTEADEARDPLIEGILGQILPPSAQHSSGTDISTLIGLHPSSSSTSSSAWSVPQNRNAFSHSCSVALPQHPNCRPIVVDNTSSANDFLCNDNSESSQHVEGTSSSSTDASVQSPAMRELVADCACDSQVYEEAMTKEESGLLDFYEETKLSERFLVEWAQTVSTKVDESDCCSSGEIEEVHKRLTTEGVQSTSVGCDLEDSYRQRQPRKRLTPSKYLVQMIKSSLEKCDFFRSLYKKDRQVWRLEFKTQCRKFAESLTNKFATELNLLKRGEEEEETFWQENINLVLSEINSSFSDSPAPNSTHWKYLLSNGSG